MSHPHRQPTFGRYSIFGNADVRDGGSAKFAHGSVFFWKPPVRMGSSKQRPGAGLAGGGDEWAHFSRHQRTQNQHLRVYRQRGLGLRPPIPRSKARLGRAQAPANKGPLSSDVITLAHASANGEFTLRA